ncbi:MAG: response regulator [Oscillospiraceae bacterium]|nr:response regulator [Oscillospiraceae bacterium]MBP5167889.1 response regulator [Oscillospiraceae bacterium]
MTIFAVEENAAALQQLSGLISVLSPDSELLCFESSLAALAAARSKEVDLALIDVDLSELSGIDLGQYLQELYPLINLIYLANDRDHGYDAMSQHASGYLLRPVTKEDLSRELGDLRHPALLKNHKRVFAQTFGNFDLFVDGSPVVFKYSKTKEIVAILVNNRGAQTTNGELIATLWEDDGDPEKKSSYLSNLRQDLQNTFTKLKLNGILLKQRGSLAIAKDKIECDLYDWLENKLESKYQYLGDYMNQYSWPETVHAEIDEISYSLYDD